MESYHTHCQCIHPAHHLNLRALTRLGTPVFSIQNKLTQNEKEKEKPVLAYMHSRKTLNIESREKGGRGAGTVVRKLE